MYAIAMQRDGHPRLHIVHDTLMERNDENYEYLKQQLPAWQEQFAPACRYFIVKVTLEKCE